MQVSHDLFRSHDIIIIIITYQKPVIKRYVSHILFISGNLFDIKKMNYF